MPLPSLHPLPANPTTGQQPFTTTLGSRGISAVAPASGSSGGVNRETLKSLQDVYWSDDEDDPDCLLCAEPLDLSDLNFKPCQCGMQICQFCYNKLLGSDARCPGCRRPYDAKAVVFQPVDWEEVKRAKERKTKRARTIKQLTTMGRRHLLGVRIVMKNMVYVIGMKLPAPGDEAIPILRSNDYFGQYGKISKIYLGDRTKLSSSAVPTLTEDDPSTSTGIYIVYVRREDAARAIASLDGIPAPQGPPGSVLKATYGTTRYCESFLKSQKCDTPNCHCLHEWGGDSDCFTKEDMETALIRPAEYDARQKQTIVSAAPQPPSLSSKTAWPKPSSDDVNGSSTGLPSAASWGKGITVKTTRASTANPIARPTKIGNFVPLGKSNAAFPLPTPSPTIPIIVKEKKERKSQAMARGKSTDSSQSAATGSAQTSPKKKPATLPSLTSTKSASSAPPPPPGLPISASTSTAAASEPILDEFMDEQASADSDAGPSSSSPAPQTPARSTESIPPEPLSTEPIPIHSPYPEPVIFSFPAHDKDFAFVLGLDDSELQRRYAQAGGYEPSPFSKTLEGLAELGVHAPELPDLFDAPSRRGSLGYNGLFRPFDPSEEDDSPAISDSTPGPSRIRGEDHNAQRTESRFGFARPSSSNSRGQSPFSNMRRSVAEQSGLRDGWYTRQQQHDDTFSPHPHHQQNDPRTAALAAQVASFVGSYDSSVGGNETNWTGGAGAGAGAESVYSNSPSHQRQLGLQQQQQQGGYERNRLDHGGLVQGGNAFLQLKGLGRSDREEYEPPVLQYGTTQIYSNPAHSQQPQPQQQRTLFSPESNSVHEDNAYQSPLSFGQQHQHPDARQLMALHHSRGSPTPLAAHGELGLCLCSMCQVVNG
nr:CCR4-NOT transcription complex subunit 4 [Kwoniella mangroviensis CBS 8507]OCF65546.1 CCR4-NOT transcription complex subunit 4 [Kwoniella mangroviensis CBS 8507]